jgi:cell wall-associated NlpC family hydrolase
VPHHFDALWNGATAPIAVGQRAPLKFSALAKATAATATVATALFAAGSADLPTTARQLAPTGHFSVPNTHIPAPLAAAAAHSPATGLAGGQPVGALPPIGTLPVTSRAISMATIASSPLWPTRPALLNATIASAARAQVPAAAPAPAAPPVKIAPPPSHGAIALAAAMGVKGTPYVWGGTTTRGFDCSGLMLWSFKKAGISLPRTSSAQSTVGQPVSRANLQPGDLVFFYSQVSHVGIYVGNGMVLHSPQSGDVVKISPLARMPFHNARRIA